MKRAFAEVGDERACRQAALDRKTPAAELTVFEDGRNLKVIDSDKEGN